MRKNPWIALLLLLSLSLACSVFSQVGPASQESSNPADIEVLDDTAQGPGSDFSPLLATPAAQSPAAGICAEFEGLWVVITIRPDIPDPRCAVIQPDQMLEVSNQRGETLVVKIGLMEAEIAPGGSFKFDQPFGEYLAPGVHIIEVQPCCGAELVLESGQ